MDEIKGESMKTIKTIIEELIAHEPNTNAKLEMLTEIGLTTQNDDVWNASEEVRNELCSCEEEKGQVHDRLQQPRFEASFEPGAAYEDLGTNGSGLFT
jgi:hypothetical protein